MNGTLNMTHLYQSRSNYILQKYLDKKHASVIASIIVTHRIHVLYLPIYSNLFHTWILWVIIPITIYK